VRPPPTPGKTHQTGHVIEGCFQRGRAPPPFEDYTRIMGRVNKTPYAATLGVRPTRSGPPDQRRVKGRGQCPACPLPIEVCGRVMLRRAL
jgi:hypothetical protein